MSIVRMRKVMQGRLQHIMLGLAVVFGVGWIGISVGTNRSQDNSDTSAVLATINGEKVDWAEFERRVAQEIDQMEEIGDARMLSAFEEAQIRGRLFDQTVNQMLRVQAAKNAGMKASRRDVKRKVKEIIDDQVKQIKEELLAEREGKKTDAVFEAELSKRGLSLSQIKSDIRRRIDEDQVREQILIDKHMAKLKSGVDASDETVRASYDEVRLAQITISGQKRSTAQAEQRAKEVVEKLRKGADFADLAREYSEDPYKKAGGDRSRFERRAVVERELVDIAFKLKVGEASDPIKSLGSFIIIKVQERRSGLPADFNDPKKKKEYREAYLAQEQSRVIGEYEDSLRKDAQIKVNDAELRGFQLAKEMTGMFGPSGSAQAKAKGKEAIKELQKALEQSQGSSQVMARVYSQIAYLYSWMRKPGFFSPTEEEQVQFRAEAKKALQSALEYTESNDLRMLLADVCIEEREHDKAIEHLQFVSESAYDDYRIHMQILSSYEQMKKQGSEKAASLIAQERKWLNDYMAQMQKQQTSEMTVPFTVKPEPGGSNE